MKKTLQYVAMCIIGSIGGTMTTLGTILNNEVYCIIGVASIVALVALIISNVKE